MEGIHFPGLFDYFLGYVTPCTMNLMSRSFLQTIQFSPHGSLECLPGTVFALFRWDKAVIGSRSHGWSLFPDFYCDTGFGYWSWFHRLGEKGVFLKSLWNILCLLANNLSLLNLYRCVVAQL